MKPIISVIVPVYGVENYIAKSMRSLLNQTFTNFEAIIINDGTLDNSIEVAKSIIKDDPRFIFLNKENGGQSSARNMGLDHAKGKYISFLDPDDYLDINFLNLLYNAIVDNKSDIAISGMNFVSQDGTILNKYVSDLKKYYKDDDILLLNRSISISLCNKLYCAKIFQNIRLPEGIIYEDDYTTFQLVYNRSIAIVNQYLYNYVQRKGSTVYSYSPIFLKSYLAVFNNYKKFLIKKNIYPAHKSTYEYGYLNRFVFRSLIHFSCYSPNYEDDIEQFWNVVDTKIFNKEKIKQYYSMTSPRRWILLLFLNAPKFSRVLLRLIHIPNVLKILYFLKSKLEQKK